MMLFGWILPLFSGDYGFPGAFIAWTFSAALGVTFLRIAWRQALGFVTDTIRERAAWRDPRAVPISQVIFLQLPPKRLKPGSAVNESLPAPSKQWRS